MWRMDYRLHRLFARARLRASIKAMSDTVDLWVDHVNKVANAAPPPSSVASVAWKFPASWENTGNFDPLGLSSETYAPNSTAISTRYSEIPCATEQGIFCRLTGNEIATIREPTGIREIALCQVLSGSKGRRQATDLNLYIFRHFLSSLPTENIFTSLTHATNMIRPKFLKAEGPAGLRKPVTGGPCNGVDGLRVRRCL